VNQQTNSSTQKKTSTESTNKLLHAKKTSTESPNKLLHAKKTNTAAQQQQHGKRSASDEHSGAAFNR
jgi:hypothetical protein